MGKPRQQQEHRGERRTPTRGKGAVRISYFGEVEARLKCDFRKTKGIFQQVYVKIQVWERTNGIFRVLEELAWVMWPEGCKLRPACAWPHASKCDFDFILKATDITEEKKYLPLFFFCLISLSYYIYIYIYTHTRARVRARTHTYTHTNGLKFFMNKVRV